MQSNSDCKTVKYSFLPSDLSFSYSIVKFVNLSMSAVGAIIVISNISSMRSLKKMNVIHILTKVTFIDW